MKIRIYGLLALPILLIILTGCGMKQEKSDAEAVATNVFARVKSGDFAGAMEFYSPKCFAKTSEDEWKSILVNLQRPLGVLESQELKTWNLKKRANTSGSGTFWVLQYEVAYAKYPPTAVLTVSSHWAAISSCSLSATSTRKDC